MSFLINCSAEGHPTPTLTWYKDGSLIEPGSRVSVMYQERGSSINESRLTVTSLTFDDIGVYECVAVNLLSSDNITQSFALNVLGGMNIYDQCHNCMCCNVYVIIIIDPVHFTTEIPDEIVGQYGESVSVNCSASGNPTPVLKWYRNGIEQCSSANLIIESTSSFTEAQSSLKITSLSERDDATYNCTATNTLPSGNFTQMTSFDLRVSRSDTSKSTALNT